MKRAIMGPMSFTGSVTKEALPLLKPPPERLDEALEAFAPLDLGGGLGIARQRRRDGQPEAHEQRQRLSGDAEIALHALNLPRQPVETAGERGLALVRAVRREEEFDLGDACAPPSR